MQQGDRLNKVIAGQLAIGRRQADDLIEKQQVLVNGAPAHLGMRVTETDVISVQGKPLTRKQDFDYIAMNKPVGYVCSRRRQGSAPTIYELLPDNLQHVKTVGRLDKDSSGLILLTNDGDFAQRLTHPSYSKQKIYEVVLDTPLQPLHQQMIADFGVELADGFSKLGLTRLEDGDATQWKVIMHEGRNRQIRRTFSALGYTVEKLHRTDFGPYSLDDLTPGKYCTVAP